jgi:hypothetical protein
LVAGAHAFDLVQQHDPFASLQERAATGSHAGADIGTNPERTFRTPSHSFLLILQHYKKYSSL